MAEGSDFALELVVGIKDMFTQQAKKIDAEVNKLEKDTTALQKTFDDTTAYKKAAAALEEMGRAGDTTAEQLQQQEKLVDDLAKSLKRAGVDINNITREEERLNRQMQETNNQLKKRSGWKDLITGGLSAVASHGMLKAFMDAGDKIAKIEILMRNQSNLSEEEIKGERGRQFRKKMTLQYGFSAGETAGTQTWFNRQNQLNGQQNEAATAASLHLGKLLENQADQEEINKAMTQLIAGGTSPEKAASLIYTTFKKGRGDAGDLMDVIQEYYTNLHSSGMTDEQFMSALIQGTTKGGVFSYDKVADSLKETFNARLSDSSVMDALLGGGKKKGVIEDMQDGALKYKFKSALLKFQSDLGNNKDTVGDAAAIYGMLDEIRKKDPAALRNITEQIGGTILAEDATKNAAGAISQGLSDPKSVVGDAQSEFDKHQQVMTAREQKEADTVAAVETLGGASADATKHLQGLTDALTKATDSLTSIANGHPEAASTLSMMAMGVMSLGSMGGAFRTLRGAGRLLGMGRLGMGGAGSGLLSGAARFGRSALLGGTMLLRGSGIGSLLSGLGEGGASLLGSGAGLLGRGLSGGAGLLGKGLRIGGRLAGPLAAVPALYDAWQDHEKGDNKGMSDTLGGAGGALAGAELGAAMGSVVPVIGTAIGGVVGGAIGYWGGSKIGDALYNWWNDDDGKKQDTSQQRLQAQVDNLPSGDDLSTTVGGGTLPTVELNFSPQISIQAMTANPEDISKALIDALREATPDLMQQLQNTLADLMLANDHQRPSN